MNKYALLPTGFAALLSLSLAAAAQQDVAPAAVPGTGAVAPAATVPAETPPVATPVVPAQAETGTAAQTPAVTQPTTPVPAPANPVPAPTAPAAPASAPVEPAATPAAPNAPETTGAAAPAAEPAAPASQDAAPTPEGVAPADGTPAQVEGEPTVVEQADPAALTPMNDTAQQVLPDAHDLTPMGMYQQADWVVKSVMILLGIACFLTWTVFLFKLIEIFVARGRARRAARVLTQARSLKEASETLGKRRDPGAFMAHAVLEEYRRSNDVIEPAGADGTKERAVSLVNRVEVQASARMRRGMGILATVGSVSPFVGLFGTVWGIMNSFIGIAETQTTNLAVVAPGIAEALFATAIGLVAAIPAVIIYNHFTRGIAAYRQALGDAGAAALRLLSRDIDFRLIRGA